MNTQDRWCFYFDEAFHDRKVTSVDNNSNIYI